MSLGKGRCVMTFGGQSLFHITVPKVDLAPWAAEAIGPARINRFRPSHRTGLNLFQNVERFLTQETQNMLQDSSAMTQWDRQASRNGRAR